MNVKIVMSCLVTFLVSFFSILAWSQDETTLLIKASKASPAFEKAQEKKSVQATTDHGKNDSVKNNLNSKNNPRNLKVRPTENIPNKNILKSVGGWGSSGGGGGVACFQDAATALASDEFISHGVPLPTDIKNKIVDLVTLDYWEWQLQAKNKNTFDLIDTLKDEDFNKIIERVKENLSFVAPIYIYRLNQVGPSISPANWIQKDVISRIYDSKLKQPLPENCRIVQIVARYTDREKYEAAESLNDGRRSAVKIEVDQDLFSRLDPINKAVLVLHEEMYLLGQIIGYSSSDSIRPMVMKFFAKIFEPKIINSQIDYGMRAQLVALFGDYAMFFGEDEKISGEIGSQESRFKSFYKMLKQIRSNIDSCAKKKGISKDRKSADDVQGYNLCKDQAMNPVVNQTWFDEEMSFNFISYYFLSISLRLMNGELNLAPLKSEAFRQVSQKNVLKTCQWIAQNPLKLEIMAEKALRYCEIIKANQSPMGIDRN